MAIVSSETTGLAPIQLSVRYVLFYGLFGLLIAVYLGVVTANQFDSGAFMRFAVGLLAFAAPLVPADVNAVGGLVPAVLGGIVGALVRPGASVNHFLASLLLAGLVYILYFHAGLYYELDEAGKMRPGIENKWAEQGVTGMDLRSDVVLFANSAKNFASYVFATLVGLRVVDLRREESIASVAVSPPERQVAQAPATTSSAVNESDGGGMADLRGAEAKG